MPLNSFEVVTSDFKKMRMSPDESLNSLTNLLGGLSLASDPLSHLQALKAAVFAIHPSALARVVPNISFNIIFEFLETDDVDQIEVCCSLLSRLLTALPASSLLSTFSAELLVGLTHPNGHVHRLTLDCLQRCADDADCALTLARRSDILRLWIEDLGSEDGEVSKQIRKSLITFGQHQHGRESLLAGEASLILGRVQDSSSTNRYRVFDVIVGICRQSQAALDFASTSGFLDGLLIDLDKKDDVLMQLTCLEMLGDLSSFSHGLKHLERIGTVSKMEGLLRQAGSDPMASLLMPGLVKFFGNLMFLYPDQVGTRRSQMAILIVSHVPSPDSRLSSVAIDTLGLIGSAPTGKVALNTIASVQMQTAVKHLGHLIFSSGTTSDDKVQAMDSLANLLKIPINEQTENVLNLVQSWFSMLSTSPVNDLMRLCQLPFTNVRCAALRVLQAIADHPWGQAAINRHPGFQEYLVNRSTESELDGWMAKYNLIKAMVDAPSTRNVFGDPFFLKLRGYVLDGPIYKETEMDVATMES